MLVANLFSWWYSGGLAKQAAKLGDALLRTLDHFSIGLLVKTWFAPFRQIDTGDFGKQPFDIRLRKFFDKLISRFVGAFMRTIVMVVGVIAVIAQAAFSLVVMVFYLLLPVLPLAGLVLLAIGWVPSV
jgi:hypothetical protein